MILSMAVPLYSSALNFSSYYYSSIDEYYDCWNIDSPHKSFYFLFQYSGNGSWDTVSYYTVYAGINENDVTDIFTRDDGTIIIRGTIKCFTTTQQNINHTGNFSRGTPSSISVIYYNPATSCIYCSEYYDKSYVVSSHDNDYPKLITNIYTFPNWYELTGLRDPNSLDVDVTFVPELRGLIDLKPKDSDGNTTLKSSFKMIVTNNSAKAIQYSMAIYTAENYRIMNGVQSSSSSSNDIVTTTASDSPICAMERYNTFMQVTKDIMSLLNMKEIELEDE